MEHKIQTSRGEIIIKDSHIFEIIVPDDEQLVVTFKESNLSFRVGGLPGDAKATPQCGKNFQVDKSQ
jgi:hypothetical protein